MFCGIEATYVPCEACLILEQDLKKEIVTCKHYGSHTCPSKDIQQIDCNEIKEIAKGYSKLTREGFIRQKSQNCLEEKSYKLAVETVRTLTNTEYIDNIKKRIKKMRRPDGHSFEAIRILQESFNKEDMYLIYQYNDGQDECLPFVIKSGTRKVELLCRLNKNKGYRLSLECVLFRCFA